MPYSTEYLSAIILAITVTLKFLNIEITDSQIGEYAGAIINLWAFGNLLYKRFKRGGVTPLGVRR